MKITDDMLSEHAAEARDLWLAACLPEKIPEHRFSRKFNRQMRRLIREQKHSAKFNQSMRILQRTIAVLLVVITVSFGCMMSVEAYRVKFIDMVVRIFNDLTDYRFHSAEASENAEMVFVPPVLSYLPDAMDKVEEHSSANGYTVTYESDSGNFLDLTCTFFKDNTDTHKMLDSENAEVTELTLHGEPVAVTQKNGTTTFLWTSNNVVYHLYSNLSVKECCKIAVNMR